jgi:hypothetical protein
MGFGTVCILEISSKVGTDGHGEDGGETGGEEHREKSGGGGDGEG